MCGLVGVAGNIEFKERKVFNHMFLVNATRGLHGCGFAVAHQEGKKNNLEYMKTESASCNYVFTKEYHDNVVRAKTRAIMGHSRHATKGGISEENTHPFICNNILGMHNGTINGNFDFKNDFDTDSEALFENISKKGIKDGLFHVLDKSYGTPAYALQFYDQNTGAVTLIRNKERPLWYTYSKKNNLLVWASEKGFIKGALTCQDFDGREFQLKELPVNARLSFQPYEEDIAPTLEKDYFEPPKPKVFSYQTGSVVTRRHYMKGSVIGKNQTSSTNRSKGPEKKSDFYGVWVEGIGKEYFPRVTFESSVLCNGCAICNREVEWEDVEDIRLGNSLTAGVLDRNDFVCDDCQHLAEQWFHVKWDEMQIPRLMKKAD